jgi:DNA-binding NarL/FixJ family response regulator
VVRFPLSLKKRGIVLELRSKKSLRQVAKETGLSKDMVARIVGPACIDNTERNQEIRSLRKKGDTFVAIGKKMNLSEAAIRKICKSAGK